MKRMITFVVALLTGMVIQAQDSYLEEIASKVIQLQNHATQQRREKVILELSASEKPRILLMDELRTDKNEYRGKGTNLFGMYKVLLHVHDRQCHGMETTGDFFERNIEQVNYFAIEKSVSRGRRVTYTFSNLKGTQELMVIPYNAASHYMVSIKVGDREGKVVKKDNGARFIDLGRVDKQNVITLTISFPEQGNAKDFESFVILNYNSK